MKKRILFALLAVVMVVALAACGGKKVEGPVKVEDVENKDSVKYTDYENNGCWIGNEYR